MKEQFERNGAEPLTMSPADMRKLLPVEIDKYARIIKAAGIKLE
jgi:tripartite-type tricarboxylate transporter receptor subunit TctC